MSLNSQRIRSRLSRRLHLEPLESRKMLTTFTVDTLSDANDGDTSAGNFSIREAISAASDNPGLDTIAFKAGLTGTINLLNGQLGVAGPLTIQGPGPDRLTISANGAGRVLSIFEGSAVEIRGLRFADGFLTGSSRGGGIDIDKADVTLLECEIVDNSVEDLGGGIHVQGPANLTLVNSTLANNEAARSGGGIATVVGANVRLINSTVSGNRANEEGGGVSMIGGTALVVNSTVTRNRANADDADPFNIHLGGGFGNSNVLLNNSIVAGNFRGSATPTSDDLGSTIADSESSHNIIGNAATSGGLEDGTNNNLVGNGGVGTRALNTILNPNLADNGGPTPTHTLVAGSPAIDSGNFALSKDQLGSPLARDQRGAKRRIDGDGNSSIVVDRGAVELGVRPTLSLAGSINYQEGQAARLIALPATLSDDKSTFTRLTVAITASGQAVDRLSIQNQGNAAGQIGVSGNQILFGGVLIGTKGGGAGTIPLVVVLNASANLAATQALIRSVTFITSGDNPSTAPRSVQFVVADSDKLPSPIRTRIVNVLAVNDAPVLSGIEGTERDFQQGSSPIQLAGSALVKDPDSVNFAGGFLLVQITAGDNAANRLSVGGPFTVVGTDVQLAGESIGTLVGDGIGVSNLRIDLKEAATLEIVNKLVRAIRFRAAANNTFFGDRVIAFTLRDGDGGPGNGTSNTQSTTVHVTN